MMANVGADTFESDCELLDVTSMHRPDTSWRLVDTHGHEHRWFVDVQAGIVLASSYSPSDRYTTPTLIWVKDGEEYWEGDDEPHDVGHLECRKCGEYIHPGYTADATTQHIPGPRRFRINGVSVSQEEFERRLNEARRG